MKDSVAGSVLCGLVFSLLPQLVDAGTKVAGTDAGDRLIVQDLAPQGVEVHEALALSSSTCQAVAKLSKADVLCGHDLRQILQFGALTASFEGGCKSDACRGDLGRALRARFLISGQVSKVGEKYLLSLSMFDTDAARTFQRVEVQASSIERLHDQIGEAVSSLLAPFRTDK